MSDRTIIAEIGSVHDGSFGNACKLIEAAAAAGADVVKFQTHIAEAETLPNAPMPPYFKGEPRFEYFQRTAFTKPQYLELMAVCKANGVTFLSSPFSLEAVDFLEEIGVESYKIPSGEVSNLPLLEYVAETKKPVLLSSGMSNWAELDQAVAALKGSNRLIVMQCASAYPCPPESVGLNVIAAMRARWGCEVGFSDHTQGIGAGAAAAALGAVVIEKHFTFSRKMYGSDAPLAMEPQDFAQYAAAVREVWRMMDTPVDKDDLSSFADMKKIFEKSIVAAKDIQAGTVLTAAHLAYKKPGDGIPAADYKKIIGRVAKRDLAYNQQLTEADLK